MVAVIYFDILHTKQRNEIMLFLSDESISMKIFMIQLFDDLHQVVIYIEILGVEVIHKKYTTALI